MKSISAIASSIEAIMQESIEIGSEAASVTKEAQQYSKLAESYAQQMLDATINIQESSNKTSKEKISEENVSESPQIEETTNSLSQSLFLLKNSLEAIDDTIIEKNNPDIAASYNTERDKLESNLESFIKKASSFITKSTQKNLTNTITKLEAMLEYFELVSETNIEENPTDTYNNYKKDLEENILRFLDKTESLLSSGQDQNGEGIEDE